MYTVHATVFLLLVISKCSAELEAVHGRFGHYAGDMQQLSYDTFGQRFRRQAASTVELYVTQCSYDNTEKPSGPSINVQGRQLQYPGATEQAAKLIHRMVRFMPGPIFARLALNSSVGLFPFTQLPTSLFDEFANMPPACAANCRVDVQTPDGLVDCSPWCATGDYPYFNNYPLGYLWAYGNFSRTYVVESNIVCEGYNPGNQGSVKENLLIREFGLTVMTRGIDAATLQMLDEAYATAVQSNTWSGVVNVYQYFMMATQAWFNGSSGTSLGGMACIGVSTADRPTPCDTEYEQRQRLKALDPQLYDVLIHVYNHDRQYLNGALSLCTW